MWRAARSGLEGDLLDLPRSRPSGAGRARGRAAWSTDLRPQLEAAGRLGAGQRAGRVRAGRGSSAARQRRAFARRGRLADVVDLLLAETRGAAVRRGRRRARRHRRRCRTYAAAGDEAFGTGRTAARRTPRWSTALRRARRRPGLRQRERRPGRGAAGSRGVTFSVAGEASTRLFPVDLVPRVVHAADWRDCCGPAWCSGPAPSTRSCATSTASGPWCADGVVPAGWSTASPGLRPTGALMGRRARPRPGVRHRPGPRRRRRLVRAGGQPAGALRDRLRGAEPPADRARCCRSCRRRADLLAVDGDAGDAAAGAGRGRARRGRRPRRWWCSAAGPDDSAWFEHRLLAEEMGVPLVRDQRPAGRRRTGPAAPRRQPHAGRRDLPADGRGRAAARRRARTGVPLGRPLLGRGARRDGSRWPTRRATGSATTRRCTRTCPG